MDVLVLVGSLRAESTNRRLAQAAIADLPDGVSARVSSCPGRLPLYDQDLDTETPVEAVRKFRAELEDADALVLVTPEYNGSLSGVIKNAIDWGSRPRGAAPLAGLPVAVLGASASPRAAQWAREDAVRVLKVAGAHPLENTVGVGSSMDAFEAGRLKDQDLAGQVRELLSELVRQAEPLAA